MQLKEQYFTPLGSRDMACHSQTHRTDSHRNDNSLRNDYYIYITGNSKSAGN